MLKWSIQIHRRQIFLNVYLRLLFSHSFSKVVRGRVDNIWKRWKIINVKNRFRRIVDQSNVFFRFIIVSWLKFFVLYSSSIGHPIFDNDFSGNQKSLHFFKIKRMCVTEIMKDSNIQKRGDLPTYTYSIAYPRGKSYFLRFLPPG